jgi:6,7-dimethyl-8-ribityllumazine synthase
MLKTIKAKSELSAGRRFAIVAARYNARYVAALLQAAKAQLKRAGAAKIEVVRVPGAFEIPVAAARLARQKAPPFDAIICLGVIIRGETAHADLIGTGVTHALARLQVDQEIPVVHAVLLLNNEDQAQARCLSKEHNRGTEAAQTAITMARVMRGLRPRA